MSNVSATLTRSTCDEIKAAKVDAYNVRPKVLAWLDGLETCERGGVPELASKLPESGLDLVVDHANLDCESCISLTDAELICESNAWSGYKVLDKIMRIIDCESRISLTDAELICESNAWSGYKVLDKGNCSHGVLEYCTCT